MYIHLGMSRLLKYDEKTSTRLAGTELNRTVFLFSFRLFCCFVFVGLGGPGGGFGAPGGGFSDSRSGGKPPLLLRLKKTPPGAPKPPPVPPKP